MAVAGDDNVKVNKFDKLKKYADPRTEVDGMFDVQATIFLVNTGALESVPPNLKTYTEKTGKQSNIPSLQKSTFLSTVNILRIELYS